MARPPRLDPTDGWHHVTNRGSRDQQPIFADERDRDEFLQLLGTTAPRFGLEVHGYALTRDRFDLLLRSRRQRLSRGMRHLQHTWTQLANRRHRCEGPLFRGRFRSELAQDDARSLVLLEQLHGDPAVDDGRWTSGPAYRGEAAAPGWLHTELLSALRGPAGGSSRRATAPRPPSSSEDVLDRVGALTGASLEDLRRSSFGAGANAARRFAVWALRAATELSQSEVADLLQMSTRQVQNIEYVQRRRGSRAPLDGWIEEWGRTVR